MSEQLRAELYQLKQELARHTDNGEYPSYYHGEEVGRYRRHSPMRVDQNEVSRLRREIESVEYKLRNGG